MYRLCVLRLQYNVSDAQAEESTLMLMLLHDHLNVLFKACKQHPQLQGLSNIILYLKLAQRQLKILTVN